MKIKGRRRKQKRKKGRTREEKKGEKKQRNKSLEKEEDVGVKQNQFLSREVGGARRRQFLASQFLKVTLMLPFPLLRSDSESETEVAQCPRRQRQLPVQVR